MGRLIHKDEGVLEHHLSTFILGMKESGSQWIK